MKTTIYHSSYHHNDFLATHGLEDMIYGVFLLHTQYINILYIYIRNIYYIHVCYVYMYIHVYYV